VLLQDRRRDVAETLLSWRFTGSVFPHGDGRRRQQRHPVPPASTNENATGLTAVLSMRSPRCSSSSRVIGRVLVSPAGISAYVRIGLAAVLGPAAVAYPGHGAAVVLELVIAAHSGLRSPSGNRARSPELMSFLPEAIFTTPSRVFTARARACLSSPAFCASGRADLVVLALDGQPRGLQLQRHLGAQVGEVVHRRGPGPPPAPLPPLAGGARGAAGGDRVRDADQETIPRAQGAESGFPFGEILDGTIPAGAGSSCRCTRAVRGRRGHPRGRGEQTGSSLGPPPTRGPSPPARGAVVPREVPKNGLGTIPAGAGSRRR
jgi:hypothetical protein